MFAAVLRIDAARSSVRLAQDASSAHSREYRPISASVCLGSQRKWPGGFTSIITDRWMLAGYRQA
jgi:hypothetical protein